MQNDIDFITAQIAQSKARLYEFHAAREQEEKKLAALNGALETLQMLDQKQRAATQQQPAEAPQPAAVQQAPVPTDPAIAAAQAAGAAERAASRAS
jgi:hypothetical protein